jgi:hypothetical protein
MHYSQSLKSNIFFSLIFFTERYNNFAIHSYTVKIFVHLHVYDYHIVYMKKEEYETL